MAVMKVKKNGVWQRVPNIRGVSAYEAALENGFEGSETEWLASLKGETGEKGNAGADGYTPVKGVDYYTEADKQEMVNLVLGALPNGDEVGY